MGKQQKKVDQLATDCAGRLDYKIGHFGGGRHAKQYYIFSPCGTKTVAVPDRTGCTQLWANKQEADAVACWLKARGELVAFCPDFPCYVGDNDIGKCITPARGSLF